MNKCVLKQNHGVYTLIFIYIYNTCYYYISLFLFLLTDKDDSLKLI